MPLLVIVWPAMRKITLPMLKVAPVATVTLSPMLLKLTRVVDMTPLWPADVLVTTTLGNTPRRLKVFAAPEAALPSCKVPPVTPTIPDPAWSR